MNQETHWNTRFCIKYFRVFSTPVVKSYVTFALKQRLGTVSRIPEVSENRLHTPAEELIILPPDGSSLPDIAAKAREFTSL